MPAPKLRHRPTRRPGLTAFVVAMAVLIATPLAVVASDVFTDVPDSNVHHADITWLADAGVTLGCNPPANTNFCPGEPVLRQQMASFLRRLAENQVVDAGSLGGSAPSAYTSLATAHLDGDLSGDFSGEEVELNSLTVSAPEAGVLIVSGSAYVTNNGGAVAVIGLRPAVDGAGVLGSGGNAAFVTLDSGEDDSLAYTVAFEVAAGSHSVSQSASVVSGGSGAPIAGDFFYNANQFAVEWHPEGSVALTPAGGESDAGLTG